MILKRIPAGVYAANCYIIMDEHNNEAVIVDPGGDEEDIISIIEEFKADPKYILLTHGHIDHIGGAVNLKNKYNIPIVINKKDEELILSSAYMFGSFGNGKKADMNVKDGDKLKIGNMDILCIETPGHTPGGMSYLVEDNVFTGDTLFAGSIGRTDLSGGDYETIIKSINTKLIPLGEEIKVFPGHGPQSTIKREKQSNPFIKS